MFSQAQILYLEEVLGIAAADLLTPTRTQVVAPTPATPLAPTLAPVAVLAEPASPVEAELLGKILASIQLENLIPVAALASPARHVLDFTGLGETGRFEEAGQVRWRLPALASMLGSTPAVMERKKLVWSLVQRFARESRA